MIRRAFFLASTAVLTMALSVPALAGFGGGTIVRIDHGLDELVAGETYEVMYTVLWMGDTPLTGRSGLRIQPAKGTSGPWNGIYFQGTYTGSPGQYIAEVTVPEAGTWLWVAEHPRGVTDLGSVDVAPMTLARALSNDTAALFLAIVATAGLALFLSRAQIKLGPGVFDHIRDVRTEGA